MDFSFLDMDQWPVTHSFPLFCPSIRPPHRGDVSVDDKEIFLIRVNHFFDFILFGEFGGCFCDGFQSGLVLVHRTVRNRSQFFP